MLISDRIFDILKEKGITQKQLADQTGIPASTISDWKHKRVNPAADKIMIISEVLGVSVYELLTGTESELYNQIDYVVLSKSSEEYLLVESYRTLTEINRGKLMGYLDALKSK